MSEDLQKKLLDEFKIKYDKRINDLFEQDLALAEKFVAEFEKDPTVLYRSCIEKDFIGNIKRLIQFIRNKQYKDATNVLKQMSSLFNDDYSDIFNYDPNNDDKSYAYIYEYVSVTYNCRWSIRYQYYEMPNTLKGLCDEANLLSIKFNNQNKWVSAQLSGIRNKLFNKAQSKGVVETNFKDMFGSVIKIGDKVVTCSGGSLVIGVVEKATGTILMIKTKYDPIRIHGDATGSKILIINDFQIPQDIIQQVAVEI